MPLPKLKKKFLHPFLALRRGGSRGGGGCENKKVNSQNNTAIDLKFCMYNPVLPLFQKNKFPSASEPHQGWLSPPHLKGQHSEKIQIRG